jgi:hypothetical protein
MIVRQRRDHADTDEQYGQNQHCHGPVQHSGEYRELRLPCHGHAPLPLPGIWTALASSVGSPTSAIVTTRPPLDRCLSDTRDHSIEQVVLVLRRGSSGRLWFERVDRRRRPANGCGGAGAIVEAESAEGVVADNGLVGRERIGLDDFQRRSGFRMFCDKA